MRALAIVGLLASCDINLFADKFYPEGLICGDNRSCPPGQKCAMGENHCRVPCSMACPNGYTCDTDGMCRHQCAGPTNCAMTGDEGDQQCNTGQNNGSGAPHHCADDHVCRPSSGCDAYIRTSTGCSICYPSGEFPDGATIIDGFTPNDSGGTSGPMQVTSNAQTGALVLRLDNNMLYWSGGPNVYACQPPDCGSPAILGTASGAVLDLIVAGGFVVFSDANGKINYCPKDLTGCNGAVSLRQFATGQDGAFYLASNGIFVFWMTSKPSPTIMSAGLAGGTPQAVASFSGPVGGGLAFDGPILYWAMGSDIEKCKADATGACASPTPVANVGGATLGAMTIDQTRAYFVAGDCIQTCVLPLCTVTLLGCNGGPMNQVVQMAADGTNLYWTMTPQNNTNMGEVRFCNGAGCNNMPKTFAMSQNAPSGIAVDNMWVYWIDSGDGTIWQQAK